MACPEKISFPSGIVLHKYGYWILQLEHWNKATTMLPACFQHDPVALIMDRKLSFIRIQEWHLLHGGRHLFRLLTECSLFNTTSKQLNGQQYQISSREGRRNLRLRPNLQTTPQSCPILRIKRRPHLERNWESEACYPPLGSNRPASSSAAATQQINRDEIFILGVFGVVKEGGFRRRAYLGPHGVLQILEHFLPH